MRLRQSFCYPAFESSSLSLDEVCKEAAAIGYEAIETWGWDESLDEFAATARRHGLIVSSITGHESISSGLNDEAEHERIEAELRRSISKAASWSIPGVICFSGERQPSKSDVEGLATFIRGVRRIVPYAERMGVNLNLEILNSKIDHPGYQCDHLDWAMAAWAVINSPRFKILFDIYHVQIMEGDVIRNLRKAMPAIGHIHTAGNPGRGRLNGNQELHYPAIARAIRDSGYEGFIGHELFAPEADRLSALKEAFEACARE